MSASPERGGRVDQNPPPTVVLLTKDNRLGAYLEQQLANTGGLKAVFHETRQSTIQHRLRYARRLLKTEGLFRMFDVLAFDVLGGVLRGRAFRSASTSLLPLSGQQLPAAPRYTFDNLNSTECRAKLGAIAPDVIVVHATGILGEGTYSLARKVSVNVHCGVLPEYRGHASTFWALRKGDLGNVGVSIHEVAAKVDTGRLFRVGRVEVRSDDSDVSAWLKAFALGVTLTLDVIRELRSSGSVSSLPPAGSPGPHYPRRGLSDHLRYLLGRSRRQR